MRENFFISTEFNREYSFQQNSTFHGSHLLNPRSEYPMTTPHPANGRRQDLPDPPGHCGVGCVDTLLGTPTDETQLTRGPKKLGLGNDD